MKKKFKEKILGSPGAVRYTQSAQSTITLLINSSNNSRKLSKVSLAVLRPTALLNINSIMVFLPDFHCANSSRIQSYSVPYFPKFGLNTERYFVYLRIQSECGKIRTGKTPNRNSFHAVILTNSCQLSHVFQFISPAFR